MNTLDQDSAVPRRKPTALERIRGLARLPKEHFSTYVARTDLSGLTRIPCSPWSYYADPFIWNHQGQLWLLVEEFEYLENRGKLMCMTLDEEFAAGPAGPVISLNCHASFPFLFEFQGLLYMVPETHQGGSVDLYVCEDFPRRWKRVRSLLAGVDAVDSVVFEHKNLWWLITSVCNKPPQMARSLGVFFTDDFHSGQWQPHPVNEQRLFGGSKFNRGRNAGGLVPHNDLLLRPLQDNRDYYGQALQLMNIDVLSPTEYKETPFGGDHCFSGVLKRFSPHHLSLYGDVIAFDVRDRTSYQQHLPFRTGSVRPA